MALSHAEQYLPELINRARLDPASEALRYCAYLKTSFIVGLRMAATKHDFSATSA